ncbi:MAG: hypothetical protein ACOCZ7_02450 [Armatimonadota bacterium]
MSYDNTAFEQLSAFLDGELTQEEARGVQERLEESEEYRALHEQMSSAREVLRSTACPEVPVGLLASIKADARAEMREAAAVSIWQRWRAPVAGVAVAAAVLLAVFTPWQGLQRVEQPAGVSPVMESPAAVAENPIDAPAEAQVAAVEEEPAEGAAEPESEDEDAMTAGTSETPTRVARAARPVVRASTTAAAASAEDASPADTHSEPPSDPKPAAEPVLALAPQSAEPSAASVAPVLTEPRGTTTVAQGPRTTVNDTVSLAPSTPSSLESEMAAGVVAGMVLDQFVAEQMVESSATMLSVVTDMPTSELGPNIAEDEDDAGSFGFSFTDAMRRALTESENDLP